MDEDGNEEDDEFSELEGIEDFEISMDILQKLTQHVRDGETAIVEIPSQRTSQNFETSPIVGKEILDEFEHDEISTAKDIAKFELDDIESARSCDLSPELKSLDVMPNSVLSSQRKNRAFKPTTFALSSQFFSDGMDDDIMVAELEKLEKRGFIPQVDGADEKPARNRKRKRSVSFAKRVKFDDPQKDTESADWDIPEPWPTYFLSGIQNNWSPVKLLNRPNSFLNDPPHPTSPTLVPVVFTPPPGQPLNSSGIFEKPASRSSSFSKQVSFLMKENSSQSVPASEEAKSSAPFCSGRLLKYCRPPPSIQEVADSFDQYGIPRVIYQEPFYSNPDDIPSAPVVFAGKRFEFKAASTGNLPDFDPLLASSRKQIHRPAVSRGRRKKTIYSLTTLPPTFEQVQQSLSNVGSAPKGCCSANKSAVSQLEHPTMKDPHGFKFAQTQQSKITPEKTFVDIMSVEIHVRTVGKKFPDPSKDPVCALFYCIKCDDESKFKTNGKQAGYHVGIIAVRDKFVAERTGISGYHLTLVDDEESLLHETAMLVRRADPDLLVGWEVQDSSWGYLVERASQRYKYDFLEAVSRVLPEHSNSHSSKEEDEYGFLKQSSLHSSGRIFLNLWRIIRKELTLTSYTFENAVFHVVHQRVAKFSHRILTNWYDLGMLFRWRTFKYYLERVQYNLDLMIKTEWLAQTSEFAKVYGILLYAVVIRGSQFKVEAMMARIARPENFLMLSPPRKEVTRMRAPEVIALNMEPISKLYTSPVAVLDFQSLYPSLMIAYNFCFSTVLGRIATIGEKSRLGVDPDYEVAPELVEELKDYLSIMPNGVVFVKPHVRQGVLSRMVSEILETRIMVKNSLKLYKDNKGLTRILQAKQLGLKLLANVTFGYTAACYSGRMPCVEIADSIVQSGRSTLERGIEMVNNHPSWGGKVVYADTDSLFVSLAGNSKEDALIIGQQIADSITARNPIPMKLQFEKVYLPCFLITKKRYVGFKFESLADLEPVFHAKGIETVRRDGCPAVAKCMETCIK